MMISLEQNLEKYSKRLSVFFGLDHQVHAINYNIHAVKRDTGRSSIE
jgi:hypothetical protein